MAVKILKHVLGLQSDFSLTKIRTLIKWARREHVSQDKEANLEQLKKHSITALIKEKIKKYQWDDDREVILGSISHFDNGKATLTAALTMYFASTGKRSSHYDKIDVAPKEHARGNVISSVRYETKNRHYVHLDFYGHADYVMTMITGARRCLDGRFHLASEALMAKLGIPRGVNQWIDKISELMDVVDCHIHFQECKTCLPFLLAVEDVSFINSIPDGGTVVTDCIETSTIKVGEMVGIVGMKDTMNTTAIGVKMHQRTIESATAGDKVHLYLKGLQREDTQRGMVLAKLGTINPYTMFTAILCVFKKKDGGEDSSPSLQVTSLINFA
ncbi:hypothetical protein V6N11_059602 [Hibiscus sabdariffa]|uniref:Tr-type G domain-containing protein n=1 Tax=Hibiscus sabdariffa TaxID=183260 RepID=A0ABR2NP80_9ROSI